jgi:hypothetical protein
MKDSTVLKALLVEAHNLLLRSANDAIAKVGDSSLSASRDTELAPSDAGNLYTGTVLAYPPEEVLSDAERRALADLKLSPDERSAVQKLIADACAATLFRFFSLMDGVGDPEVATFRGTWLGGRIVAASDDDESVTEAMLHDEFLEHYWEYKKAAQRSARRG